MKSKSTIQAARTPPVALQRVCSAAASVKDWHTKVAELWIPESTLTFQVAKDLDNYQRKIARLHLAQLIAANEPPNG